MCKWYLLWLLHTELQASFMFLCMTNVHRHLIGITRATYKQRVVLLLQPSRVPIQVKPTLSRVVDDHAYRHIIHRQKNITYRLTSSCWVLWLKYIDEASFCSEGLVGLMFCHCGYAKLKKRFWYIPYTLRCSTAVAAENNYLQRLVTSKCKL